MSSYLRVELGGVELVTTRSSCLFAVTITGVPKYRGVDKNETQKIHDIKREPRLGNPWWLGDRMFLHHGLSNVRNPKGGD